MNGWLLPCSAAIRPPEPASSGNPDMMPSFGRVRRRELVDHRGQVVFEILLAALIEERHDFVAVERVVADEPEIDALAFLRRRAGQALRHGFVLGRREGRGIDLLEDDAAARERGIFLEQVAHARRHRPPATHSPTPTRARNRSAASPAPGACRASPFVPGETV